MVTITGSGPDHLFDHLLDIRHFGFSTEVNKFFRFSAFLRRGPIIFLQFITSIYKPYVIIYHIIPCLLPGFDLMIDHLLNLKKIIQCLPYWIIAKYS